MRLPTTPPPTPSLVKHLCKFAIVPADYWAKLTHPYHKSPDSTFKMLADQFNIGKASELLDNDQRLEIEKLFNKWNFVDREFTPPDETSDLFAQECFRAFNRLRKATDRKGKTGYCEVDYPVQYLAEQETEEVESNLTPAEKRLLELLSTKRKVKTRNRLIGKQEAIRTVADEFGLTKPQVEETYDSLKGRATCEQ
jgi:hypothetical protein